MRALNTVSGVILAASLASAAPSALAQASKKNCDVESVKQQASQNTGLRSVLNDVFFSSRCGTIVMLLKQTTSSKTNAGRQLEQDRPFNPVEAQQQLTRARANPEIQAAVASELEGVTDPNRRLLLEAVVMHDEDQLLARDLLLQQLRSGSKL